MSVLVLRSRFWGRVSARPWDLGGDPLFLVMPALLGMKKTLICFPAPNGKCWSCPQTTQPPENWAGDRK